MVFSFTYTVKYFQCLPFVVVSPAISWLTLVVTSLCFFRKTNIYYFLTSSIFGSFCLYNLLLKGILNGLKILDSLFHLGITDLDFQELQVLQITVYEMINDMKDHVQLRKQ